MPPPPQDPTWYDSRSGETSELVERIATAAKLLSERERAATSYEGLRGQYAILIEAYNTLGTEHARLMEELRATRAELQAAVSSYAQRLRLSGSGADEVTSALRDVVGDALLTTPADVADSIAADVVAWTEAALMGQNGERVTGNG